MSQPSETVAARPAAPAAPVTSGPGQVPGAPAAAPNGHGAHGHGGPAASSTARPAQHPPLTLEGWYVHHQLLAVDRAALRAMDPAARAAAARDFAVLLGELATPAEGGWTGAAVLVGAQADAMLVHFRPTLDALGVAQRRVLDAALGDVLRPAATFLSVTEAGMYQVSAQLAKAAVARGGAIGDEQFEREAHERLAAEASSPHVLKRLYPERPAGMDYVCFYPMSKRRAVGQNWYEQTLDDRNRMMWAHGKSGRRYAGRVQQVVTGAIGLDAWEWGVTLFAAEPLEFKRIVTEMRFDEASTHYGEFGAFYVGRMVEPEAWVQQVVGGV